MTSALPAGSIVLFVDGTCIFCNRLVSFILRRDRRGIFYLAAAEPTRGQVTSKAGHLLGSQPRWAREGARVAHTPSLIIH